MKRRRIIALISSFFIAEVILLSVNAFLICLMTSGSHKWDVWWTLSWAESMTPACWLLWRFVFQSIKPRPAKMSIKSLFDEGLASFKIVAVDRNKQTFQVHRTSRNIPVIRFIQDYRIPDTDPRVILSYMDGTGKTIVPLKKEYMDEASLKKFNSEDNKGEEWKS